MRPMLLVLYKKVLIFILPECEVLYMKQSREKLLNPGFRIPLIRICDERIRPSRGDIMTTTSNPHISTCASFLQSNRSTLHDIKICSID